MKTKKVRNCVVGFWAAITLTFASASSYSGYIEAKTTCEKSDGTITEDNVSVLAFNWSVSCENEES